LARNSGKAEIVDRLLEHADRTLQIEKLLNAVIELEQLGAKFGAKAQAMLADGEVSADEEAPTSRISMRPPKP
jgi:hypothetical protein